MVSLVGKLIKIQTELKAPKNQFNSFGNYAYRNAEDIVEAAKPLLSELSCALVLSDKIISTLDGDYVEATATLYDGNSVDTLSASASAKHPEEQKGMSPSQITGAASSYARKYALNGLFCIDDTKDADSMDNTATRAKIEVPKTVVPKQETKKETVRF